ncbi:hypothetical protein EMCRGX_G005959 [Ephydatia muelleri]
MEALARSYIWWPKLDEDIEKLSANCEKCGITANTPPVFSYHPWQQPHGPWDRIHVDFGEWRGIYFLVVVDAYSKWPEVRVMRSTTTQHTMEVLSDIFATHGLPRVLVTDNGPQFTAKEFSDFLKTNCIVHRTSAPYHPATNGLAENMVKNVKQWCATHRNKQTSIRNYVWKTPAYPNILVLPNMLEKPDRKRPTESHHPNTRAFQVGEMVWVKEFRPTSRSKWCKGIITDILGALTYNVQLLDGHERKAHLDHLRSRARELETNPNEMFRTMGTTQEGSIPMEIESRHLAIIPERHQSNATVPERDSYSTSSSSTSGGALSSVSLSGEAQITAPTVSSPTHTSVSSPARASQPLRRSFRQSNPPKRYIEECS